MTLIAEALDMGPHARVILMIYKDMDDEDAERLLADMVPQDDLMFVLSNKQKVNGAAALLDKDIMQKIVEKFGEDFYILPSSIHECIIVSADADMDTSQLTAMIQEVNAGQVAPDERLSDHPYRYTVEDGLLSI